MTWHTKYNHLTTSELLGILPETLSSSDLMEYTRELKLRLEGARRWD